MPKQAGQQKRGLLITAVAVTAMAVPLATAALGLAGALNPNARVETQQAREEHRSQALERYLRSRLESPQGWQDWVSNTTTYNTATGEGELPPAPAVGTLAESAEAAGPGRPPAAPTNRPVTAREE